MDRCGRCGVDVPAPEWCIWCVGALCSACWEAHGHCGHPEMDAINAELQTATPERRRALMEALGPIGARGAGDVECGEADLPDPKAN